MKTYRYFMSYHFKGNGNSEIGSIGIDANKKIENMEELEKIKEQIKRDIKNEFGIESNVIILNFQILSIQEVSDGNERNP